MSDRSAMVVHRTQRVSRFFNYKHGCRHWSCLGHFVHYTNAVITVFGKMSTFATNETLAECLRILVVLRLPLADLCPCWLHQWASRIASCLRANVTLGSQEHFLVVGANFLGTQPKMFLQLCRRFLQQRCSLHGVIQLLARYPNLFSHHLLPLQQLVDVLGVRTSTLQIRVYDTSQQCHLCLPLYVGRCSASRFRSAFRPSRLIVSMIKRRGLFQCNPPFLSGAQDGPLRPAGDRSASMALFFAPHHQQRLRSVGQQLRDTR